MGTEVVDDGQDRSNGASRRAVLRAGVGVGVGLVAWSGPTITSLGGTPAYAAGCTFVTRTDISGGCRNLDYGSGGDCDFRYHAIIFSTLPPGHEVLNPIIEGACCGIWTSTLVFPADENCAVRVSVFPKAVADTTGARCSGDSVSEQYGPERGPFLNFEYPCFAEARDKPFSEYRIEVVCNTTNAPVECLD